MLRTLSKALAFAGARCGAVMGPPDVIDMLNAIQAPYAMSTPVVECVEDALSGPRLNEASRKVAAIIAERERLRHALGALSHVTKIWPSSANFLLVEVRDPASVMEAARRAGILLRYFGGDLAHCVRISVGTESENDALLSALTTLDGC